ASFPGSAASWGSRPYQAVLRTAAKRVQGILGSAHAGNEPRSPLALRLVAGARAGGPSRMGHTSARGADRVADAGERRLGVVAKRGNRGDADDDDQGQHHGILDRGRAVFFHEEIDGAFVELTHGWVLSLWYRCRDKFLSASLSR